jgi:hypothetical protein
MGNHNETAEMFQQSIFFWNQLTAEKLIHIFKIMIILIKEAHLGSSEKT